MFCFVKKSLDYSYIVGGYNDMFEIVSVTSMFSYKRVQMSSLVNSISSIFKTQMALLVLTTFLCCFGESLISYYLFVNKE